MSAVFRKGGDACFLVRNESVFDPRGGYFKKGRVFMPSWSPKSATPSNPSKTHRMIKPEAMTDHQKVSEEKRREFEALHGKRRQPGLSGKGCAMC